MCDHKSRARATGFVLYRPGESLPLTPPRLYGPPRLKRAAVMHAVGPNIKGFQQLSQYYLHDLKQHHSAELTSGNGARGRRGFGAGDGVEG